MIDFSKPLPDSTAGMTEADIRALRDYVFERPIPDLSWVNSRVHWLEQSEQQWLLRTAQAMQTTRMPKQ